MPSAQSDIAPDGGRERLSRLGVAGNRRRRRLRPSISIARAQAGGHRQERRARLRLRRRSLCLSESTLRKIRTGRARPSGLVALLHSPRRHPGCRLALHNGSRRTQPEHADARDTVKNQRCIFLARLMLAFTDSRPRRRGPHCSCTGGAAIAGVMSTRRSACGPRKNRRLNATDA